MMTVGKRLIFISYRRADTDALAGRLKDRMTRALPDWDVFVDVDVIPPGEDFKRIVEERLSRASVFVPLIGERWLGASRRLHDPDDMVRHEIKFALTKGVRIVPVVVNQARMPSAQELPDDIAPLARRNAIELRHSRFDDDFVHLVRALTGSAPADGNWNPRHILLVARNALFGIISGMAVAIVTLVAHFELTGASASERLGYTGATLYIPLFAILGGALWSWVASR
jgi:hypothetical protein